MKDLFDKLSSYNIFNYLLPGVLFVVISDALTSYRYIQEDMIIGLFLYYFIGLIISRIGSVVVEPTLKWLNFITFSSYEDYINASKSDKLIEVLSEANNMYRTFCSLFICLAILKLLELLTGWIPVLGEWSVEIMIVVLFILFCLSYRKQTKYICNRIDRSKK